MYGVAHQNLRPDISEIKKEKEVKALIQRCWADDPQERPEFKEILETLYYIYESSSQIRKNK